MNELKNTGKRRLGVPGRPSLILEPNQAVVIDDDQVEVITANRTVARWLSVGILTLTKTEDEARPTNPRFVPKTPSPRKGVQRKRADVREELVLPDGLTGEGFETHHSGGGWYQCYVNGFKVTDRNVRKDEVEKLRADYDDNED